MALVALLAGSGCVTSRAYERKVAELESFKRGEAERTSAAHLRILELESEVQRAREQYQDDTRQIAGLTRRAERLQWEVSTLTVKRVELSAALSLSRAELDELREHARAAEARARTFRDLYDRLQPATDGGQVRVMVRQGRMLIALPTDLLFSPRGVEITKGGEPALAAVASALRGMRDRRFMVVGHTDNQPAPARFLSSWELSLARATAVARALMARGLPARSLGIAGKAEFDPVATNDLPEYRGLNRRIEIVLEPNLAELPPIPGTVGNLAQPALSGQPRTRSQRLTG